MEADFKKSGLGRDELLLAIGVEFPFDGCLPF